jgi:uncharacterized peroxidase-related enzyme
MPRLQVHDPETTKGWSGRLLKKVAEQRGVVPNMMKAMANSEWVLDGFLTLNGNLGQGRLGARLIKEITLATSEFNGCEYCVSAHTEMARKADLLTPEQSLAARRFQGVDEKSTAALAFAKSVLESKGKVGKAALDAVKAAGFGDAEVVEMLAVIVGSTLANYVSNVGELDLDFPEAPPA